MATKQASKRLFVSLYILISISIIAIGWLLDWLWQQQYATNQPEYYYLQELAQLVKQLPADERDYYLQQLNQTSHYSFNLLTKSQVFADSQLLEKQVPLTTELDDGQLMTFLLVGEQVLQVGPYQSQQEVGSQLGFTLIFYLLLALVVFIWVWPLARDLQLLNAATQAFGEAKWQARIQLSSHSRVIGLADTFNDMAAHISGLLENQKHLTNAVSHELRTPLARLKFALALIKPQLPTELAEGELMAGMAQDISEIENLTAELLTYAALEHIGANKNFESCQLSAICQDVISKLAKADTLDIDVKILTQNHQILADARLIERAIQNIVLNAMRFANSKVTLTVTEQQEHLCLSIEDDGHGIADDEQAKIFQPFYRAETEQGDGKGFGLGLAIVQRIMTLHQGQVSLSSEPGCTCFTLYWPLERR